MTPNWSNSIIVALVYKSYSNFVTGTGSWRTFMCHWEPRGEWWFGRIVPFGHYWSDSTKFPSFVWPLPLSCGCLRGSMSYRSLYLTTRHHDVTNVVWLRKIHWNVIGIYVLYPFPQTIWLGKEDHTYLIYYGDQDDELTTVCVRFPRLYESGLQTIS